MFTVKPRSNDGRDDELRAVGVLARVSHREQPCLVVSQFKVLVYTRVRGDINMYTYMSHGDDTRRANAITVKLVAVDGFPARTVTAGKVAALDHELGDDTVERGSLVAKAVLACGELAKVSSRPGHDVVEEREDDATRRLVVDVDVELGWERWSVGVDM